MQGNSKGVQEPPVVHGKPRAANEVFPVAANEDGAPVDAMPGWDPYEVWRARVKESAKASAEREDSPQR